MRRIFLLALLFASPAWAQQSVSTSIIVKEEGAVAGRVRRIDCVGTAITCTVTAGEATFTVTAGGGGANTVETTVALTDTGFFSTTVTGQAWVAADSEVICSVFGTTADGLTPEAVSVGNLTISVSDRVVGTGFKVNVYSPNGLTGTVRVHCTGA